MVVLASTVLAVSPRNPPAATANNNVSVSLSNKVFTIPFRHNRNDQREGISLLE